MNFPSMLEIGSQCTTPEARRLVRLDALWRLYRVKRNLDAQWIAALRSGDCAHSLRKESGLADQQMTVAFMQYKMLYRDKADRDLRDLERRYDQGSVGQNRGPKAEFFPLEQA